jgi:hypothetical protein
MINLNSNNRDLLQLSEDFYIRIENNITSKLIINKTFLNSFLTDNSQVPLGDFLKKEIKQLITLPLDKLEQIFNKELHQLFKDNYVKIGKIDSNFKKAINQILFYEEQNSWKAYQLSLDIGTNTCAYCNRTYITTLGTDNKKFARGDFDHYLAKSEYPYLRFSFFNLIPCCVICNRNAKKADPTSLKDNIYPYEEGFDNKTTFTYLPKSYEEIIGKGKPEIDFLYLGDKVHIQKSKGNINLFRLKQQYSIHTQELNDIIHKRRVFSDSYLKELQKDYPQLIKSFDDAYLLAFGKEFDLANDEKRPLSKFTRDIVNELGMSKSL